jgi:hypothetical protein
MTIEILLPVLNLCIRAYTQLSLFEQPCASQANSLLAYCYSLSAYLPTCTLTVSVRTRRLGSVLVRMLKEIRSPYASWQTIREQRHGEMAEKAHSFSEPWTLLDCLNIIALPWFDLVAISTPIITLQQFNCVDYCGCFFPKYA